MIGICPFGDTCIPINPSLFARMPPFMQTLSVQYMADMGMPASAIQWATGLDPQQLEHVGQMHHCVALVDEPDDTPEDQQGKAGRKRDRLYPVNAERALLWLIDQGGRARISHKGLEASAGLARNTGRQTLSWLLEQGFLGILGERRNNAAPTYQVTKGGWRLARALQKAGLP